MMEKPGRKTIDLLLVVMGLLFGLGSERTLTFHLKHFYVIMRFGTLLFFFFGNEAVLFPYSEKNVQRFSKVEINITLIQK